MKLKIALLAASMLAGFSLWGANAQSVTSVCVKTASGNCTQVSATNPFPVTGGGGGGGGTSSTFGAAFPADGTAAGFKDSTGTNMAAGNLTAAGAIKTDTTSVNGVTTLTGAGATGTGAQRVTAAQDTSTVAGAAPLTTGIYVTGPSAAALATSALQTTGNTSASTIATNTGTTATGIGAPADAAYAGSGSASVIAAAKGIYAAATSPIPAGTNLIGKAGIDQTTPGTTNAVQNIAGTTGGTTPFTLTAANSTNATNIKNTAGLVDHISVYNNSATLAWVSFYDTSGTPTCGTSIKYQVMIPANSTSGAGAVEDYGIGVGHASGIGICVATGIAGTGSVAASAYVINVFYK
jgi:hypothetical protein